jgi:hypothetical protein
MRRLVIGAVLATVLLGTFVPQADAGVSFNVVVGVPGAPFHPHSHFVRRAVVVAPAPYIVAPAPVVYAPPVTVINYPTGSYVLQARHHRYVWVWVPRGYFPAPSYPY